MTDKQTERQNNKMTEKHKRQNDTSEGYGKGRTTE